MKSFRIIIQLLLALTFIISAYSKLISPGLIEIILVDQGIFTDRMLAGFAVRILAGIELALGLLYLFPYNIKKITIPVSLLLLIFFTGYLFYTGFVLGDKENCGCFGTVVEMSPVESIIKNLILIAFIIVLFKLIKEEKRNFIIPPVLTVAAIAAVFLITPLKDVKDFKFEKYTSFVGSGRVDLTEGDKLLCVFSLDCEHCQLAAKELWGLEHRIQGFPETYVLFFSEGGVSVDSFKTITGSNFAYSMINSTEFFDLIGTTSPRIYWLKDGIVKKFWDNNFIRNIVYEFKIN